MTHPILFDAFCQVARIKTGYYVNVPQNQTYVILGVLVLPDPALYDGTQFDWRGWEVQLEDHYSNCFYKIGDVQALQRRWRALEDTAFLQTARELGVKLSAAAKEPGWSQLKPLLEETVEFWGKLGHADVPFCQHRFLPRSAFSFRCSWTSYESKPASWNPPPLECEVFIRTLTQVY